MTPNEQEITGIILGMFLDYDPETGFFRYKLRTNPNTVPGEIITTLNEDGYVMISVQGVRMRGHRIAWVWMTGKWPNRDIDHINGQRADNRYLNLREANRSQNLMNGGLRKSNRSGVVGVHFCAERQKWVAQIKVQKRTVGLGRFEQFQDAVHARKKAEERYYKSFVPLNRHFAFDKEKSND